MPVSRQSFFLGLIVSCICLVGADGPPDAKLCVGETATFSCLKENFRSLYRSDYKRFFKILHDQQTLALKCNSAVAASEVLSIAKLIEGSAELGEDFREFLENLLQQNPRCLMDALVSTDIESRRVILKDFLRHPLFISESEARNILSVYAKDEKYKTVL